jgi:hypothetical protein
MVRFPWTGLLLAALAFSLLLLLFFVPARWLSAELVPLASVLATLWAGWRLLVLERAVRQYHAWHVNASWTLTPEALARQEYHG